MSVETRDHRPAPPGPTDADPTGSAAPVRRSRRWTTAFALGAGLALGLLVAVLAPRLFGDDSSGGDAGDPFARTVDGSVDSPDDLLPDDVPVPQGASAASAEEAVRAFLTAEVDGDLETSFRHLDDAGRAAYGSPEGWESAHADVLPRILAFEVGERTEVEDGREAVRTVVSLEPGIDPVVGLTPAEAIVTWDVVRNDDGWGVSLDTSPFEPVFPDDTGVVPAAERWAEVRQRCDESPAEHGLLVGSPALADSLCGAEGRIVADGPVALGEAEGQPVSTAFGDGAALAARVVRLSGPVDLAVVLVPVGDDWTVIGILP